MWLIIKPGKVMVHLYPQSLRNLPTDTEQKQRMCQYLQCIQTYYRVKDIRGREEPIVVRKGDITRLSSRKYPAICIVRLCVQQKWDHPYGTGPSCRAGGVHRTASWQVRKRLL